MRGKLPAICLFRGLRLWRGLLQRFRIVLGLRVLFLVALEDLRPLLALLTPVRRLFDFTRGCRDRDVLRGGPMLYNIVDIYLVNLRSSLKIE
jgi:hypothetical protein